MGTQIYSSDKKFNSQADILKNKDKIKIVQGGKGGLGNTRFKSSLQIGHQEKITKGTIGEKLEIILELKVIADIGIIGLPKFANQVLNCITRAKPKIADYPFTTINPNLGILKVFNKEYIIADIPGIIKGAHKGVGLGIKFLKHIERCSSLIHLVDITDEDICERYNIIRTELKKYSNNVFKKKEIVILNKIDLLNKSNMKKKLIEFKKMYKQKFYYMSVLKRTNLNEIIKIIC